jgi:iron complex outermembrane receptor protein
MKYTLITILLFISSLLLAQESDVIKGKIIDKSTGEPMIGATVIIKGTTIGTATDLDGNFEFALPEDTKFPITLEVAFLGFQTISLEM